MNRHSLAHATFQAVHPAPGEVLRLSGRRHVADDLRANALGLLRAVSAAGAAGGGLPHAHQALPCAGQGRPGNGEMGLGQNMSKSNHPKETAGFSFGSSGTRVPFCVPILDRDTQMGLGAVGMSVPPGSAFSRAKLHLPMG